MIRHGQLKDYNKARQMLKDGGFIVIEHNGELVKKLSVNGEIALSIAKWNNGWVFNYNRKYFAE